MPRSDALNSLQRRAEELRFFRADLPVTYRTAHACLDVLGALNAEAGGTMIHEAVGHGLEADLAMEGLSCYKEMKGMKIRGTGRSGDIVKALGATPRTRDLARSIFAEASSGYHGLSRRVAQGVIEAYPA